MIGWLSGTVRELDPAGSILLETNGIGYDVAVSMQALCSMQQGEAASLSIHPYVREDQLSLFCFLSSSDRDVLPKTHQRLGYLRPNSTESDVRHADQ